MVTLRAVDTLEPTQEIQRNRTITIDQVDIGNGQWVAVLHVECRGMGHQWRHLGIIGANEAFPGRPFGAGSGMAGRFSNCVNCGGERIKWISRSGEKINRYRMPANYARTGEQRLTNAEWSQALADATFASLDNPKPKAKRRPRKR